MLKEALYKSKTVLNILLSISFLFTILIVLKKLLAKETGVYFKYDSGAAEMPCFTMCPFNIASGNPNYPIVLKGQNWTMLDFMDRVPSVRESIKVATFLIEKDYEAG